MTSTGTVGSPYSGGMASPYSDLSVGVPSPPTVVTDYNRSMDVVNTDGPHLVVVEQPQSKFRFRYKSEMVGTHGQLKAERADRNKAIFPTVKLMNWRDGPAVIRLALYTGEDNFNQRRRHVHELSGKNCDRDTGMCEMVVDQNTDYTASFQNLGIIHIAKRDVKDIIKQRKKTELIEHAKMRQPHRSLEEIRHSITPTDMKKFDEDAEEIAKMMDLNKVVLRFQAFHYDTSADCYRTLTRPVDSELVVNLKNASTGELKIVRMSDCSAPSTGGTEVWMLVEKVKKNNIKIKFYEQDSDYKEVWSAYGEFNESDVHHQYAIIFRTPPYRTTNLRSSVRVKVQLERPNDKDTSEPRDFTYYPESRKRQIPFMETAKLGEDEDYSNGGNRRSKRPCHGSSEPLDLTYCEFSRVLPYSSSHRSPSSSSDVEARRRSSSSSCPCQSNEIIRQSSESKSKDANQSNYDIHAGSLFRSFYERKVDRDERKITDLLKVEPMSNSDTSEGHSVNLLSPLELPDTKLFGSQTSLTSVPSPTISFPAEDKYNTSFNTGGISESGSQYSSNHTSPCASPYSSPYHQPSVDTDFRLQETPKFHSSSHALQSFRNCHSLDSEVSPYYGNTLQVPGFGSRSSSTHSLRSSPECYPPSHQSQPGLSSSSSYSNLSTHADSLPELSSRPQQSSDFKTYTELKPASGPRLNTTLHHLRPSDLMDMTGGTEDQAMPSTSAGDGEQGPSNVAPPIVMVTPEEESSYSVIWRADLHGNM